MHMKGRGKPDLVKSASGRIPSRLIMENYILSRKTTAGPGSKGELFITSGT